MGYRKKYRIYAIAKLAILLIFAVLYIREPWYVERTLSIRTSPGEYRFCYYVPGREVSVTADREEIISSVSWEEMEAGTVVWIELKIETESQTGSDEFTIRFVNAGGSKIRSQETLDEGSKGVQWAGEYTYKETDERENGYYFASANPCALTTGWLTRAENHWDIGLKLLYGTSAIGGALVWFVMWIADRVQRKAGRKNVLQKYARQRTMVENYLAGNWKPEEHKEIVRWMERQMGGCRFFSDFVCWAVVVALGDVLILELVMGDGRGSVALMTILAAALFLALLQIRYRNILQRINQMVNDDPLAAFWCYEQYRFHIFEREDWKLVDLNFAVFMNHRGDWEEAAALAEEIWKNLGQSCRSGIHYLQYHYIQYSNYHFLKNEEAAKEHLKLAKEELARERGNKYYREVEARIAKLEGERESSVERQ